MATDVINNNLSITGNLTVGGTLNPSINRSGLTQENLAVYPIPWTAWRVWDALATNLPGTPATDDLGLSGGTWATNTPYINTGDVKNTTITMRGRFQFQLPPEYVAGETINLVLRAGMLTTVASSSATVDVEAFISNRESLVDGSDLYAGAAVTINSTALADRTFALTPAALGPGDIIDFRVTIAIADSATATAVIGVIGSAEIWADIKG